MDAKRVTRGFELQARSYSLGSLPMTEAEREELELIKSDARAEMRTPPELADPDGDGPQVAKSPMLDGSDSLENFKRADARDVGRTIGQAFLDFLKGLVSK